MAAIRKVGFLASLLFNSAFASGQVDLSYDPSPGARGPCRVIAEAAECSNCGNTLSTWQWCGSEDGIPASYCGPEPHNGGDGEIVYLQMCYTPARAEAFMNKEGKTLYRAFPQWYCPQPYRYSSESALCEASCGLNDYWDPVAKVCMPSAEEESCETRGEKPIDFIQGRKYRKEFVIETGRHHPLILNMYYNNQLNHEKGLAGISADTFRPRAVVATAQPHGALSYASIYNDKGRPTSGSTTWPEQYTGGLEQYWRHTYDDVLQKVGEAFIYHPSDGRRIVIDDLGQSFSYPELSLEVSMGEADSSGYLLTNADANWSKLFDDRGRLMRIAFGGGNTVTLNYNDTGRLERVTNAEGASIEFQYSSMATESIYSVSPSMQDYPVAVITDTNEKVELHWNHEFKSDSARYHMLTFISAPSVGASKAGRAFAYNDSRWPASVTDIYKVSDVASGTMSLYAHFKYDDSGRAIFSGLAGGFDAERVEYLDVDTRVVTNALGKKAIYEFADISGARRLKRVTGEPTQNCVQSEVEYIYDAAGNITQKIENGLITQYAYDSENREVERIEAAGTPEARTVATEYHPTLNKPVKITEPGKVTAMTYDAEGRLLSNTTHSTVAP